MSGWPITKYGIAQVKKYTIVILSIILSTFIIGNIIGAIVTDEIVVEPDWYTEKDGHIFFSSAKEYIEIVKSYPYDFGTEIKIHKMRRGESFWDAAMRNHISIDTIIGANPFLDSLVAEEDTEIVIPGENGVLFAFDSLIDLWRMSGLLEYKGSIRGDYLHSIFRIFSTDDIRFAFFKNSRPEIVNNSLENLYNIRKLFKQPVYGHYTSMYGLRIDPIIGKRCFHNGIDIRARYGSPVYAAREGFVSSTGWLGRLGLTVTVLHRNGYETMYGHLSSVNVKQGDWVTKKDIIGELGSTGRSTGPHLHFTLKRHGILLDPLLFIW